MPSPRALPIRPAVLVFGPERRRPLPRPRGAARFGALGATLLIASGFGLALFGARVAASFRGEPASVRCPEGTAPRGPRCCPEGQALWSGACGGTPTACPPSATLRSGVCEVMELALPIEGGVPGRAPADWQGAPLPNTGAERPSFGQRENGTPVGSFLLDRTEVTERQWEACVQAQRCAPRTFSEAALPVRAIEPALAREYCRFRGGDLPTSAEWLLAAAGPGGRRFPWGPAGLVCRRAAFGLVSGPCAEGAVGPDLVGSRPDGATPEGVFDLSGNVAEWTRDHSGDFVARGGSYASKNPAELQTASLESSASPASHIGFRCAYPLPQPSSPSAATE